MKKHRQTEKQFSLKDELFNRRKVEQLAKEIEAVYPEFATKAFIKAVLKDFPEQELMERVRGILDRLREFLPSAYSDALPIILAAQPPVLDEGKTDNDFGDFIYAPYSYFVATYGCTEKHVARSLAALRELTKRFSAEGALRDFLNAFPKETLEAVEKWSKDTNYHVRRLASEGTRPNLPWAKKITVPPKKLAPILDRLHADRTRYVVRSVANHLNDVTKVDKSLALRLLRKWNKEKRQSARELSYLTNHALRSLVRAGDSDALRLIGFDTGHLRVSAFTLGSKSIRVGESVPFSFTLTSTSHKEQNVMADYIIHFNKASGKLAPKTYKLSKLVLRPNESVHLEKNHTLRLMSTRTLYPGKHVLELQINGRSFGKKIFLLK